MGGTYIRLADLGSGTVFTDEIIQYLAGQSIAQGDGAQLASGNRYTRGIDVSRAVAFSTQTLGDTTSAMRVPSALFGVFALFIFAAVLWFMAGAWPAFWGTLLLAIYPEAIFQSRHLRFYTYQLCFGLVALYTGWRVLRPTASEVPGNGGASETLRKWAWAAATLVLLLLAARVQVVALSVATGWAAGMAVVAVAGLYREGVRNWSRNVPLQLVGLGALACLLVAIFTPHVFIRLYRVSQLVPAWAEPGSNVSLAYYYHLNELYPLIIGLAPLIFVFVIARHGVLGLHLTLWFAVPVLLHSFVFPWKGERFILLAVPALFAVTGLVASAAAGMLYRTVADFVTGRLAAFGGERYGPGAACALVAMISLFAIVTMPAFNAARKTLPPESDSAWASMRSIIHARPHLVGVPVGHVRNLEALFHWGSLDFSVARTMLQHSVANPDGIGYQIVFAPPGTPDPYTGIPVLSTPESIRAHFAGYESVLVGLDREFEGPNMEPRLREVLTLEAEELCRGRCGSMELYLWPLERDRSEGDRPAIAGS